MAKKLTCFVIIGYGIKTSYATGEARELNLDETYEDLIKPVFVELNIDCYRAIDKNLTGNIDKLMLEEIKNADIVVADLSTLNANVMWELGVRHSLKPRYTLMICELEQMKALPFDVNHYPVYQYAHTKYGIPNREVSRFRDELKSLVVEMLKQAPSYADSPVFDILGRPSLKEYATKALNKTKSALERPEGEKRGLEPDLGDSFVVLMQKAENAKNSNDFSRALAILKIAEKMANENMTLKDNLSLIISRQALCTYKSKEPSEQEALIEARNILNTLNPLQSRDTEVLGLSGKINKQLHQITGNPEYLDTAISFYERGFKLKNDYYNGINTAFMLYLKASIKRSQQQEWEELKTNADYIRNSVLRTCLQDEAEEGFGMGKDDVWILLTIAEAYNYKHDKAKMQEYELKASDMANTSENSFALSSYYEQKDKIDTFYPSLSSERTM